jgi:DNA invertase Pin-like site-specific DNA recombinase
MENRIQALDSGQQRTTERGTVPEGLRVAAYIRVSSEGRSQEESYETQRAYFEELLAEHPDWFFAGIYADEGVSGTTQEHRTAFKRLMRHCKEGKIDRILTKSISRFCRNTVDFLAALETLKLHHVTIFFEKEKLDTATAESEVMLTAFGAVAQEESRGISANLQWGNEKRYRRGEARNIPIYGYRYAEGELAYARAESGYMFRNVVPCPEEAAIVQQIFREVADGKSFAEIARAFNQAQIPAPPLRVPRGKEGKMGTAIGIPDEEFNLGWTGKRISQITKLERYAGDVRGGKTYTEDYKTHKNVLNRGERMQYYIQDHHPAIIDRRLFQAVQTVHNCHRTKQQGRPKQRNRYLFTGRLVCKRCGRFFDNTNRNRAPLWYCPSSVPHGERQICTAEWIYEKQLLYMCRKALIARFRGERNWKTTKTEQATMRSRASYMAVSTVLPDQSDNLIAHLLERLELVQRADTMEHDIGFLHHQLRLCQASVQQNNEKIRILYAKQRFLQQQNLGKEDALEINAIVAELARRENISAELEQQALRFQQKLYYLERYAAQLEDTYEPRQKTIMWLRTLPNTEQGMYDFLNGLNEDTIHALFSSIEVENASQYQIRWFDDLWTDITLDS